MTDTTRDSTTMVVDLSNPMIALHKEQFGRGPRRARSHFAGPDMVVTVLYDAMLPAENAMVEIGELLRVQESRMFLQEATRDRVITTVEQKLQRKVLSFQSAWDGRTGIVTELFILERDEDDEHGRIR